ncbi:beta-1,3-glucanase family protein [Ideonella sp.]|uniref:beta-1,3-glucanase family protein n=1 Tax=Ideonella sp. TaxID=1929293 RepID=UPI0035AECA81
MRRLAAWLALTWASLFLWALPAQAQTSDDYTQGVAVSGSVATIWFKPTSGTTTWVDAHYKLNSGPQQNIRMSWVAGNARYEQIVQPVANGNVIDYSFTYNKGTPAYDTPWFAYTIGSGGGGDKVVTPTFNPPGGTYASAVNVTLATSTAGATIHYTLDGTTPSKTSPTYTAPITVKKATTIKAVGFKSGLTKSAVAKAVYKFDSGGGDGNAAAPVLSPWGGSFSSPTSVTMTSATAGATIKYTLDGSSPTASSPTYSGPVTVSSSQTLRAIATKSGMGESGVVTADYWIGVGTWNKRTTFNMVNNTRGVYPDSQVYWSIIGKDWATGQFVHVDVNGNLIPMQVSDNGALWKNGEAYTNYFIPLSQSKSVTIPPINSARMMLSIGSPMYIKVLVDGNGNIGYAGANIENPNDPNIDVYFDFIEMAIVPESGFFGNTTRVDHFGFPVKLRLQGLGGYDRTVGETETRDALFSAFQANVPTEFKSLSQAPYSPWRIVAPGHGTFKPDGPNAHYMDSYIQSVWNKYTTQTLTFTNAQGTFTGHVVGGRFEFTDGQGTYNIYRAPTTAEAFLGNGVLNDATGTTPGTPAYDKQLQIQAQMCAALNRHVVDDPDHWSNSNYFYPGGQAANWFAKFWHDHNVAKQSYGFPYDDVWNYSSSLHTPAPTTATVSIGW